MASFLPDRKESLAASVPFLTCTDAKNDAIPELSLTDIAYLNKLTQEEVKEDYDFDTVQGDNDDKKKGKFPLQTQGGSPTANILPDEDDDKQLADLPLNDSKPHPPNSIRPPTKRNNEQATTSSSQKKPRPTNAAAAAPVKATIVGRITPEKAPGDDKDYLVITLSNGLRAILAKRPLVEQHGTDEDEFVDSVSEANKYRLHKYFPPNFPNGLPLSNPQLEKILRNVVEKRIGRQQSTLPRPNNGINKSAKKDDREASLAVVVNVGITDDPNNCLGLAHFTEHMVHYGSEKYPDENGYWNLEHNCSSDSNAFTENHTTTYYSTVPLSCIALNMDMMANMLAKPLFRRDMTLREVNSVDAEFHLKKHYDVLRRWFLFQHVIKNHPLGKMGFGTKDTLMTVRDIHKVLRDFHSQYYVASAMTLAFESTLPFEAQEELILNNFSDLLQGTRRIVRETQLTAKEKCLDGKCFTMDYIMQGLCSYSNLWVVWTIPGEPLKLHTNKSIALLVKILRNEKEGGLADYLMKKQYIWLMLCNSAMDYDLIDNKYATFVALDFYLTPNGEAHVQDILEATFVFLYELLQLPDSKFLRLFQEMKLKKEWKYKYLSPVNSTPVNLAALLQRLPEKDVLKTDSWSWKDAVYTPGEVHTILKNLVEPSKMVVIQTLPSTNKLRNYVGANGGKVCVAPYINAEYVAQDITQRFGNLRQEFCEECAGRYKFRIFKDTLDLTEFNIMPMHYGKIPSQELICPCVDSWKPTKVHGAYHWGNELDNYLRVCVVSYLNTDVKTNSRHFALSLLWMTSAFLSMTNDARNNSFLVVDDYGISIGLTDWTEKWLQKMEMLNNLVFVKPVSEEKFKIAQTALINLYDFFYASDGDYISHDLMHFMSCIHSNDALPDALTHIQQVSVSDVNLFVTSFKWGAKAEVSLGGNISVQRANTAVNLLNSQCQHYATSPCNPRLSHHRDMCWTTYKHIPSGERCIKVKPDRMYGFTVTVTNFYCVGSYDPAKYVLWRNSLLFFPMRAFQYLRIIKQLGYSTRVYFPRKGIPMIIGVSVTSTAAKFTACELDKHLDDCMVDYGKFLNTVDEDLFQRVKKLRGLADQDDSAPVTLADARKWYQRRFNQTFAGNDPCKLHKLGMGKLIVQVLGNDLKSCPCAKCKYSTEWNRCELWKHFQFAQGSGPYLEYFIDDPRKIRNGT